MKVLSTNKIGTSPIGSSFVGVGGSLVLPSCALSCTMLTFLHPELDDDFEFTGFRYADE